jgi:SAM-dependent methyltransferase
MTPLMLARVRRRLEASPSLVETKRAVWALSERLLPVGDTRITRSFPMFHPNSAGSPRNRAALTVQAANQTFPLLLELLSYTSTDTGTPIPIESYVDNRCKRTAAEQLKELCDRHGSDKATRHDYHLLYGPLLAERDSVTAVLEIGLGTNNPAVVSNMGIDGKPGASLRAFREFLPHAQIFGADVDQDILFAEERISTFFVDQTDPRSFAGLAEATQAIEFDLIIDDGLHSPNANLATILFGLGGRLKAGGSLVVEDIAPPALPLWQVTAALMPAAYECRVIAAKGAFLFLVQRLT